MKPDSELVLRTADHAQAWRAAVPLMAGAVVFVVAIYWQTAKSMLATWASSDTYAHGYVIVPITLVLVWLKRRELAGLVPRPDYLGFVVLAVAGFAWLLAEVAQVQVLQQYAMTAMIPGAVLALAGRRVAWAAAFPLAFLLFAVPFGEAFLPRLMGWTADFAVAGLRLSGIPVYREGTFFTIPSGQWSVIEACSGLRYLIASITVGTLYAYLSYRRRWKRALFVALSIAVPIVANGMRAYIIVMIGHLSSMKLAVGVDHFIYGWLFFGIVIGLLFWLGSFWRDVDQPSPAKPAFPAMTSSPPAFMAAAALGVAGLAAVWPLHARYLSSSDETPVFLAAPAGAAGWTLEPPATHWQPHYAGAAASALAKYRKGDRTVVLYLAHYRNQRQGAELVGWQNSVAGAKDMGWAIQGESQRNEGELELRETRLRSNAARLLVWDWYRVAGRDTADPFLAKALLARDKLLGRSDASSAIAVATPYEARTEPAAETLRLFLGEMRPAIEAAL
jgi:exosortase A